MLLSALENYRGSCQGNNILQVTKWIRDYALKKAPFTESRTSTMVTEDIQPVINIKNKFWCPPLAWNEYIDFVHDNPDKKTVRQIIFGFNVPISILKELMSIQEDALQVGIVGWYWLVSKNEFKNLEILTSLETFESQLERKEIWSISKTGKFFKLNVFILTKETYTLWRGRNFKKQVGDKILEFNSCAKYKLCPKCDMVYTNTHLCGKGSE